MYISMCMYWVMIVRTAVYPLPGEPSPARGLSSSKQLTDWGSCCVSPAKKSTPVIILIIIVIIKVTVIVLVITIGISVSAHLVRSVYLARLCRMESCPFEPERDADQSSAAAGTIIQMNVQRQS
jgi:hypothetical protein